MGPYLILTREAVNASSDTTWDVQDARREFANYPDATHIVFMRRGSLRFDWSGRLPAGWIGYVRASKNNTRKLVRLGVVPYATEPTLEELRELLCEVRT